MTVRRRDEPLRRRGGAAGSPAGGWNVANALTCPAVLVPVLRVLLFRPGRPAWRFAALAVFVVASLTDRLDGELARRYGLVTDFGKIADPIADKALTGSALVGLSAPRRAALVGHRLIMGREIGVTLLRFAVIRHGVIPASWGGKIKTVLQVLAISLYLLPGVPEALRWLTMGAAVLVTVGHRCRLRRPRGTAAPGGDAGAHRRGGRGAGRHGAGAGDR